MSKGNNHISKPGPAPGQRFGMAAVFTALEGTEFPKSKKELINESGSKTIEWYKGQREKLKDLLEEVNQDDFLNMADLTSAIGRVVESAADRRRSRIERRQSRGKDPREENP